MTVSSVTNRWSFAGNGVTTQLSVGKLFSQSDITVYLIDSGGVPTTQTITTHYTVSGVGTSAATVTMVTAPATGYTCLAIRNQPFVQATDFKNQGSFLPESHENTFDKLFMMIARIWHRLSRSISLSDTSTASLDLTLPSPIAGRAIGWNDAASGLANIADFTGVSLPLTVANGGTGGATASQARTNLDVQQLNANLTAIAGLTSAANKLPYFTGSSTAALADFTAGGRALVNSAGTADTFPYFSALNTVTLGSITAAGRALLDDADATAQLATLGVSIATQANQEAATDTTTLVTSGRQHFSPAAAKFWLKAGVTGNILASYNITSITDTGTGDVAVTIATDFSSAEYAIVAVVERTAAGGGAANARDASIKTGTLTAGTFSLECWDDTATTNLIKDPASWHCIGFGDL